MDILNRIEVNMEEIPALDRFIVDNPLNCGGALSSKKVSYTIIDDGDIYAEVIIPFCGHNLQWAISAINFVQQMALKFSQNIHWKNISFESPSIGEVLLHSDYIEVHLCVHACNPD